MTPQQWIRPPTTKLRTGTAAPMASRHLGAAVGAAVGVVLVLALSVLSGPASASAGTAVSVATWNQKSVDHVDGRYKGQGFATVLQPNGTTKRYYTGDSSVPQAMINAGWNHDGDPDSARGYIFEAYQNSDGAATKKLFHVTAPDGTMTDYVHQDLPGEMMNNSFAAVSPDAQWMVSGEWEALTRLLVMATPILNPSAPGVGHDLPVTGQILLNQTVVDIQGCTFQTSTRLFCTSDDPIAENGLPRKALLQIDLAHAIDGGDVHGTVSLVFALPVPPSICPIESPGSWPTDIEIEGIDYDRWTGVLGLIILPPRWCAIDSRVYNYLSPQATATHFRVAAPATVVAGTKITATLTASDAEGAAVDLYTGTANLTTTDPAAQLPKTAKFLNGKATVVATFLSTGAQSITATDPVVASITGTSAPTAVAAPATTTTTSTSTTSTTAGATTSNPAGTTGSSTSGVTPSAPPAFVASGSLPMTGGDVTPIVALAVTLLAGGALLVRHSRTRDRT